MESPWPSDRLPYSPITERPPLPLPDGARIVVWPCVNVEHWAIDQPMPRTIVNPPGGAKNAVPDLPNWAWHEYGQRVGFWRLKKIFDEFGLAGSLMMNASVCDVYPQIVDASLRSGWELVGHAYVQKALPVTDDQRDMIHRCFERLRACTGRAPLGWLSPALAETRETVDWLHEAGFRYVADWVLDDQPLPLATAHGTMVSLPYTQELNDLGMILIQGHRASEYADRAIDQFDQLLADSAEATRVMCFTLHPYIMGAPHRARHVRRILEHVCRRSDVKVWTGEQILDWYTDCRGIDTRPTTSA
jgi:allantoinase